MKDEWLEEDGRQWDAGTYQPWRCVVVSKYRTLGGVNRRPSDMIGNLTCSRGVRRADRGRLAFN